MKLVTNIQMAALLLIVLAVAYSCNELNSLDDISVTVQEQPTITSIEPEVAKPGDTITIKGTNFDPQIQDNAVLFGETKALITASSATEIQVIVPEDATTGSVTVNVLNFSVTQSSYPVIATLFFPLTDNNDDVEEVAVDFGDPVGTMDLDSGDLELGEVSSGQGIMNIGLRYNNISIPQGSIISEAYIQFNADDVGSDPVEITIYGENTGNAAAYTEDLNNLSSRDLTTANIVWDVPEWVEKGDRGTAQKTVNIAAIIQEIINRNDWETGNSLNIILKPTGVSLNATSSSGGREAENYSSSKPNEGAELSIAFQ